jgi:hypothetical protein
MTALVSVSTIRPSARLAAPAHAVPLVRLYVCLLMVFPSTMVVGAVGAAGSPAGLVGILAFFLWFATSLIGLHDPFARRNPTRSAFFSLWVLSLVSYVVFSLGEHTSTAINAADRWLLQLACWTGVALVTAECLDSMDAIRKVQRALVTGGGFCGSVAVLQYWFGIDLVPTLRTVPGFTNTYDLTGASARHGLTRVTGTTLTPIELGVVSAMILPLASHLLFYDDERSRRIRWVLLLLVAVGIPVTVSRSSVIAVVISMGLFIVLLPPKQRVLGLGAMPMAVVLAFMAVPGLIGTLYYFFVAGTTDTSVAVRVDDLPLVERLVSYSPWVGSGGGTYLPENMLEILDDQYLKTTIELGIAGLVTLVVCYFGVPVVTALNARKRATDPAHRALCGALAGSALAAAVCSFLFDSLAFSMFAGVYAVIVGLIGAAWRLAVPLHHGSGC